VRRGEVRWAEHPDWPRRPVLILTRDEAIDRMNAVFVILATTNIRGLPTEIELGAEDGMPRACVLNADNTATLAKSDHHTQPRQTPRGLPDTDPRHRLLKVAEPAHSETDAAGSKMPVLARMQGSPFSVSAGHVLPLHAYTGHVVRAELVAPFCGGGSRGGRVRGLHDGADGAASKHRPQDSHRAKAVSHLTAKMHPRVWGRGLDTGIAAAPGDGFGGGRVPTPRCPRKSYVASELPA
jgi:mRNA interferase MazF